MTHTCTLTHSPPLSVCGRVSFFVGVCMSLSLSLCVCVGTCGEGRERGCMPLDGCACVLPPTSTHTEARNGAPEPEI